MRLLYLLFFITIVLFVPILADEKIVHKKVPLVKAMPLLSTIEGYAIHMGSGKKIVHVFVDPLCPHSQNLVEMISTNEKALLRNNYFFYLYTLKRLHSEKSILAIYNSVDPLASMLTVMVDKKSIELQTPSSKETVEKVEAIAKVAKALDVYKRPYLIFIKKPKEKRGK